MPINTGISSASSPTMLIQKIVDYQKKNVNTNGYLAIQGDQFVLVSENELSEHVFEVRKAVEVLQKSNLRLLLSEYHPVLFTDVFKAAKNYQNEGSRKDSIDQRSCKKDLSNTDNVFAKAFREENNRIRVPISQRQISDLTKVCKEIEAEVELSSAYKQLSSYQYKILVYEEIYFSKYRVVQDKTEPLANPKEILRSILDSCPKNIDIKIQNYGETSLDISNIDLVLKSKNNGLYIIRSGNRDNFLSRKIAGRISIRIKPEYYSKAFEKLAKITGIYGKAVMYSKIMNPIIIGQETEDAVIYLNDMNDVNELMKKLVQHGIFEKGFIRESKENILFMDTVSPGIYTSHLPVEANEPPANGSLGAFFSHLAANAVLDAKTQNIPIEDAIKTNVFKYGFGQY